MSTHEHTRNNVTAALKSIARAPALSVQRVTPIGERFARVLGTISASATPEQLLSAVRKLNPKLVPIAGTFTAVASNGYTMSIEGIVGSLEERIVLDESNRESFTAVASNMYMDVEERLWSLKKTEGGDILISSHAGDDREIMNSLMACVASSQVGVQEAEPASNQLATARANIEGADLISYVSPSKGVLTMGFALASVSGESGASHGLMALAHDGAEPELVDRNLIVAHVAASNIDFDETSEMEAVASGNFSLEMIEAYYKKMFIRRPEYFQAFWSRFKSHAFA